MSRKIDRALRGPSWVEVILGALISLILGVLIGAAVLVFRPVVVVKEMPKDDKLDAEATYFVEGSRDATKGRDAAAKKKAFVAGQTVTVIEDELNALAGPPSTFARPKDGDKKAPAPAPAKEGAAAASDEMLAMGTPNFRLRDDKLQIGIPVNVNVGFLGLEEKVVVQTRGGFVKDGDKFVYEPSEFYVGCLPVTRLPYVSGWARNTFLNAQTIPEDVKSAWPKLTNVAVEGNVLKLTMP